MVSPTSTQTVEGLPVRRREARTEWGWMDDEGQFRELFEATYGAVRRFVYHLGATGGVADDGVAETFLVAWRRVNGVPGDDPVHWLFVVPRNVLRDGGR